MRTYMINATYPGKNVGEANDERAQAKSSCFSLQGSRNSSGTPSSRRLRCRYYPLLMFQHPGSVMNAGAASGGGPIVLALSVASDNLSLPHNPLAGCPYHHPLGVPIQYPYHHP